MSKSAIEILEIHLRRDLVNHDQDSKLDVHTLEYVLELIDMYKQEDKR